MWKLVAVDLAYHADAVARGAASTLAQLARTYYQLLLCAVGTDVLEEAAGIALANFANACKYCD